MSINSNILNKLKKINKEDIDNFNNNIPMSKIKGLGYKENILKIIIKNNNIYFEDTRPNDQRFINYRKGLTKWFKWNIGNNKNLKKGTMFVNVSDTYNYGIQDLGLLVMTKPKNKKGLLFPDDSWFCSKINNKCYNQNNLVKIFIKNCLLPYSRRKKEFFFKGSKTGKINNKGIMKWNTRELLENYYKGKEGFNIKLYGTRIPSYDFCNYQILFNLPGHQPRSYRFREILMTCSLVVDIAVEVSYDNGKNWNESWVQFWYELFKPLKFENGKRLNDCKNCHFVQLTIKYIEGDEIFNKEQFLLLTKNIDSLNNDIEKNTEYYKNIAKRGCKLMRSINMKTVYAYINHVWNSLN